MQNQQSEKMPKAMLRVMFALVVFILIAVSVARVSGLSLVGTSLPSQKLSLKPHYISLVTKVVL